MMGFERAAHADARVHVADGRVSSASSLRHRGLVDFGRDEVGQLMKS